MNIAVIRRPYDQPDAPDEVGAFVAQLIAGLIAHGETVVISDEPEMIAYAAQVGLAQYTTGDLRIMSYKSMRDLVGVAIVVGGDGTMLQAMKNLRGVPVLGINMGYLGFITDVPLNFPIQDLLEMLNLHVECEKRTMLVEQRFTHSPEAVHALNDVVISRHGGRIITFNVNIDGEFAYKARGDGVMISTPTGSTAYAMAAGGSIVVPTAQVFEVVPMFPQTMSHRPLIVSDDSVIEVEVTTGTADVFFDGVPVGILQAGEISSFSVVKAPTKALILHPNHPKLKYSYFNTLRTKLNWQHVPGTVRI